MIQEKARTVASGYLALALLPALTVFGWLCIRSVHEQDVVLAVI
jgi:hypothetical protein